MNGEDRVMSAEADRAECVKLYETHQHDCENYRRGKRCSQCYGLWRHVQRTERQIALLSAPGETQELF